MLALLLVMLLSINLWSAETTYGCTHFQKDIDYWQEQYSILLKQKKEIDEELRRLKIKNLEKPIKVPRVLQDTQEETYTPLDSMFNRRY